MTVTAVTTEFVGRVVCAPRAGRFYADAYEVARHLSAAVSRADRPDAVLRTLWSEPPVITLRLLSASAVAAEDLLRAALADCPARVASISIHEEAEWQSQTWEH